MTFAIARYILADLLAIKAIIAPWARPDCGALVDYLNRIQEK
jgi:hypothetical protein